jgi:uncharacterized peroxidase-related enzyme
MHALLPVWTNWIVLSTIKHQSYELARHHGKHESKRHRTGFMPTLTAIKEMPMSRLNIDTSKTPASSQEILSHVHKAFGATPNMFKVVANSPAALKSMWGAFGALGGGTLGAKLGEQIAVAIANKNACEYCLAAHTVLGKGAGASAEEMSTAQSGKSSDAKTAAALRFALAIVGNRAQIAADEVNVVRNAGFTDEQIMEIMAHVALNTFTNYVNIAFDVPLDFPKIELIAA